MPLSTGRAAEPDLLALNHIPSGLNRLADGHFQYDPVPRQSPTASRGKRKRGPKAPFHARPKLVGLEAVHHADREAVPLRTGEDFLGIAVNRSVKRISLGTLAELVIEAD